MKAGIVAAVLLLVASQAWAECAWVLWMTAHKISADGKPAMEITMPYDGYTNKHECDRALERSESREEQRRKQDASLQRFFVCLPDTIDPRGPKGGGR